MNTQEYIASGVLEHYVLGLLTEAEQREVEQNAIAYPEVKAELEAIEESLNTYAQSEAVPMREGLSAAILSRIDELENVKFLSSKTTSRSPLPVIGVILFSFLLGTVVFLNNKKLESTQEQLQITENRLVQIQKNCNSRIKYLQDQINLLRDPSIKTTKMQKGELSNPEVPEAAIANVYNNPETEEVYVDLIELPAPPTGKQYQLWGIRIVDGELQPTSMGIITPDTATGVFTKMKYLENVDVYAISLEDLGEQEVPDLRQIYVLGEAS
ncbi:MAG: anti-sigma factor [Bacteroidota bacterium]